MQSIVHGRVRGVVHDRAIPVWMMAFGICLGLFLSNKIYSEGFEIPVSSFAVILAPAFSLWTMYLLRHIEQTTGSTTRMSVWSVITGVTLGFLMFCVIVG